jgi:hypothetical protein
LLTVWPRYIGQATPWRDDDRLNGKFADGIPDDVQVWFENPNPNVKDEIIWVTVIDYHSPTDQFVRRWYGGSDTPERDGRSEAGCVSS